jgi:hypothetical protein
VTRWEGGAEASGVFGGVALAVAADAAGGGLVVVVDGEVAEGECERVLFAKWRRNAEGKSDDVGEVVVVD